MTSFMDRYGARLIANGYPIIPIQPGTKKPGCHRGGGWRDYPDWTRHASARHHRARAGAVAALARRRHWHRRRRRRRGGADDAELAHRIERLARERLGDTPALRIGRSPKRLLVYRTVTPFKGIKRHPLEVLCLGQQFVAYAIHPVTGRPYEWPEESLAELDLGSLPAIDEAKARVSRRGHRAAAGAAQARISGLRRSPCRPPSRHAGRGARGAAWIPNADLDYDSWVRIGMAIKGAIGEAGAELFAPGRRSRPRTIRRHRQDLGRLQAQAHRRRHALSPCHRARLEAGSALVLDGSAPRDAVHPAAGLLAKVQSDPDARCPRLLVLPPQPAPIASMACSASWWSISSRPQYVPSHDSRWARRLRRWAR
jgi:hypothetical protein